MRESNYKAVVVALFGGILIGFGVFVLRTGGLDLNSNIQIRNSKREIDIIEVPKININLATQVELEALPKIGEVTARKIIGERPYVNLEELVGKKILTPKVYEEIKDLIDTK